MSANDIASMIDFATLMPPGSPNTYLVCPPEICRAAEPDEPGPVFNADPTVVIDAMAQIVEASSRARIVARGDAPPSLAAVDVTRFLRFKDDIYVLATPLENGGAALAVYSASRVGYYDFGANKRRVRAWIAALRDRLNASAE